MGSLQNQGLPSLLILLALLLAACVWMAAILLNVRGYGERGLQRGIGTADRLRRAGLSPTGMTEDQRYRFARALQKVVASVLILFLLAGAIFVAVVLLGMVL